MTIRVYRSFGAIVWDRSRRSIYTAAEWESIDFDPRPAEDRPGGPGNLWRVRRSAPIAVAVCVPFGSRLVERADGTPPHLSPFPRAGTSSRDRAPAGPIGRPSIRP